MSKVVKIDRKTILSLISHILVISIVFILPEVIFSNSFTDPDHPAPSGIYIHTVVYIIVFYYNYFFLIDRLLFRKTYATLHRQCLDFRHLVGIRR